MREQSTHRNAINELIPKRLYQRGQILTWQRDVKTRMFKDHNIRVVLNLWPKLDHDLEDMNLLGYYYVPINRSADINDPHVHIAANAIARILKHEEEAAALILCEAGKTRSVFVATLIAQKLWSCKRSEAFARIQKLIPNHSLKSFMTDYLCNDEL